MAEDKFLDPARIEQQERRLRALEDAEAIRNLKAHYAALCDRQYDADGIAALFTEDALWDSPAPGRFEGREAIRAFDVVTGRDLKAQSLEFLQQHFGKASAYYYWAARGIDERPVRADRIRKSVGAENTFATDLFTYDAARAALQDIIEKVWEHCDRSGNRRLVHRSSSGQTARKAVSDPGSLQNSQSGSRPRQARTRECGGVQGLRQR
jgi:nucleotidyltransferase/DNA polymerase involved in DNA repair